MSIIDEIKQARTQLISEEHKRQILLRIKNQLIKDEYAIIDGASHYPEQSWKFGETTYVRVPFKYHAAISEWLQSLGFKTSRYYNRGGVDNGLKVWF